VLFIRLYENHKIKNLVSTKKESRAFYFMALNLL